MERLAAEPGPTSDAVGAGQRTVVGGGIFYDKGYKAGARFKSCPIGSSAPGLRDMLRRAAQDGALDDDSQDGWVAGWCDALQVVRRPIQP